VKKNIFIKSVLRQPIRAFILAVLIGAAAFAFVARATEFIVVNDELTRIESFYRAVGILSPLRTTNFTTDHDVSRALEVIESNRHVMISDTRHFTQGVYADMLNVSTQLFGEAYFNPVLHGIDVRMHDHFFIGTLRAAPRLLPFAYPATLVVAVNVDELVLGDPGTLRAGDRTFTNERGQSVTLFSRQEMHLYITQEERALFEEGLWDPFEGLEMEAPTLFRATGMYMPNHYGDPGWFGFTWLLRPLVGEDTLQYAWIERLAGGEMYRPMPGVKERSDVADMVFFVDATDDAAFTDMLDHWQEEFLLISQNLSSVTVMDTKDMSAMPRFSDPRVARLLDTPLFPRGRWLNHEDYLNGNHVAVIPAPFAVRRGIQVGDSITINLRDNPRPNWIDSPTTSQWARGLENWWDNSPQGWWGTIEASNEDWQGFPSQELTLEVVGIYQFFPQFFHNFISVEIFIPAGLIPEGFGWDDAPHLTGMYSFVLNSPRLEEAFLRETRTELYNLGFAAVFMPNDFEHLAAATDPIRLSITVNLVVFAVASALILAFVVLLYLRQWRKSVAIAQALGIPGGTVLRQLFTPVVLLWVPSMIVGSVIAWFFAISQAEAALENLAVYEGLVLPGVYLLLILCGLLIAFILASVWFGGYGIVRRPVLTQLQGGTQKRRKAVVIDSGVVPEGFAMGEFELSPMPAKAGFSANLRSALRHSLRHIFRTPIKTALAMLLALIFVFSLGWLNNTIIFTEAEVTRLWDTTIIEAELFRVFEDGIPIDDGWVDNISPNAWNAIEYSGFYRDSYLESFAWYWEWSDDWIQTVLGSFMGVSHLEGLVAENTRTPVDEQLGVICVDMELEFMPGFGPEDFVYVTGERVPLVVRRDTEEPTTFFGGYTQVIAVFDGGMQRGVNRFGEEFPIYIIPIELHRTFFAGQWPFYGWWGSLNTYYPTFATARFTIDPARNRELDRLRELARPALENNELGFLGTVPLLLHIHDDVIHNVIIPMEQNLSLLRILYPIAIGVAFLLALGLSLLTMLQSAKNAAIMRVLGKPRGASQLMLCTEQLIVCIAGILFGLLILFVFIAGVGITPLLLAGVYLGGAVIGSAIGAFVISMRAPLDLLQVSE